MKDSVNFVKKCWIELCVFASYAAVLLYISPLDITQLNNGDKGFGLLYSAMFLERLHPSSLYTFLSFLVTHVGIPDGMALAIFLSIVPSIISNIFVYLTVKKITKSRFYAICGSLFFMSSWIFIAQAVKLETYMLVSMLFVIGYYVYLCGKSGWAMFWWGLSLLAHWIAAFPAIFGIIFYEIINKRLGLIKKWYVSVIVYAAIYLPWLFLLKVYNPDLGDQPFWFLLMIGWGAGPMSEVVGNIPRFLTCIFSVIGFGIFPALLYFIKDLKNSSVLLFAFLIPVFYALVTIADAVVMQLSICVAFMAVAAGCGMQYVTEKWIKYSLVILSSLLFLASIFVWNIDTRPTSARDMINQLNNIPDKSFVVEIRSYNGVSDTYGGSVAWTVDYYNRTHDKDIFTINAGYLGQSLWVRGRQKIADRGIVFPSVDDMITNNPKEVISKIMTALQKSNPDKDFYYYKVLDTHTMKMELAKWKN